MHSDAEFIVGLLAILFIVFLVCLFEWFGLSLTFKKAGVEQWKAFVPFYNYYVMHELTFGEEKWPFFFLSFVPYVNAAYVLYMQFAYCRTFKLSTGLCVLSLLFPGIMNLYIGLNSRIHYICLTEHISDSFK